jgi:hypothetical protein
MVVGVPLCSDEWCSEHWQQVVLRVYSVEFELRMYSVELSLARFVEASLQTLSIITITTRYFRAAYLEELMAASLVAKNGEHSINPLYPQYLLLIVYNTLQ